MTNSTHINDVRKIIASGGSMTRFRSFLKQLMRNWKGRTGALILLSLVLLAIFGYLFAPYNPVSSNAPSFQPPTHSHLLGTDYIGEDIFSWFLVGTGTSLLVGASIAVIAITIGVAVGVIAGYFGGYIDNGLMRVVDVLLVIPGFPLLVILSAFLPPTLETTIIVLGILSWPFISRVIRSQTLTLRRRPYIMASELSGLSGLRIIVRDIIPNLIPLIFINAIFLAIGGVVAQAGLAFFGLGDLRSVNWGTMLYWFQAEDGIVYNAWWWLIPPGIGIILLGVGANFLSNAVYEITQPARGSK